jgi:hypothetical protein
MKYQPAYRLAGVIEAYQSAAYRKWRIVAGESENRGCAKSSRKWLQRRRVAPWRRLYQLVASVMKSMWQLISSISAYVASANGVSSINVSAAAKWRSSANG